MGAGRKDTTTKTLSSTVSSASSSSSSAASSSKKKNKWGIPEPKTPEITLLERLVWVKYKTRWWPALLYHSYSELQHHLYDQLDMVLKAQFAMAIMKQMQERRDVKVARLLGRSILEVVEVEEDTYCEFYWQLPNILPRACKRSHYGSDMMELYFDFHRALDQVEDIIREVSHEHFALLPNSDDTTWLERAHLAVQQNEDDTSSIGRSTNKDGSSTTTKTKIKNKKSRGSSSTKYKEHLLEAASIVSNNGGVGLIGIEQTSGGLIGVGSDVSKASASSKRSAGGRRSSKTTPRVIEPNPSALSISESQQEDLEAPTSTPSEAKSRRSTKTKASQAVTEVVDNRTGSSKSSIQQATPEELAVDEARDPPNSSGLSTTSDKVNVHHDFSKIDIIDSHQRPNSKNSHTIDRSNHDDAVAKNGLAVDSTIMKPQGRPTEQRALTPFDLLPGLGPDDIVPGLTDQIDGARSTWRNVLGFMSGSRDPAPENRGERQELSAPTHDRLQQKQQLPPRHADRRMQATMPRVQNKEMQSLVTENDDMYYYYQEQGGTRRPMPRTEPEPSFWQRLTCYTGDL